MCSFFLYLYSYFIKESSGDYVYLLLAKVGKTRIMIFTHEVASIVSCLLSKL